MTQLPAAIDSEETMIGIVAHWIDLVAVMLKSETARRVLRNQIRAMLASGAVETLKVVEAARAGHAEADLALREFAAELLNRNEVLSAQINAYTQEALLRGPVDYPAGANVVDPLDARYWHRRAGDVGH